MLEKDRSGLGKQLGIGLAIGERPLDQLVGAVANPGTDHRFIGLRQTEVCQSQIDCQRQLGGAVNQGAVQIKQHQIKCALSV